MAGNYEYAPVFTFDTSCRLMVVLVQKPLFPRKVAREELNSLVDKAADIIRTATDYKFILVLLFLKRVSDVWKEGFETKKKARAHRQKGRKRKVGIIARAEMTFENLLTIFIRHK